MAYGASVKAVVLVVVTVAGACLAACSGESTSPVDPAATDTRPVETTHADTHEPTAGVSTTSAGRPLHARCPTPETVTTGSFTVSSPTGAQLYAVEAGDAQRAVVLVHGSGSRGVCNWAAEFPMLVGAGFRTVGFDAACVGDSTCGGDPDPVEDLISIVNAVRDRGATDVVVVGASAGGPLAIQVAARSDAAIRATVALSPAGIDDPATDLSAGDARVPIMYVLSEDDPAATVEDLERLYVASQPAGAEFVVLPAGSGHAQATLHAPGAGTDPSEFFERRLLPFLGQHTSP